MRIFAETKRLIMREISEQDALGYYELDSDPEVHTYLGSKPIKTIAEAEKIITYIRDQYIENGIGRWAVIEKESGNFIGWSGFKLMTNEVNNRIQYYDLGYRFIKQYWGKGYATETAVASLNYGFTQLKQQEICAMADVKNIASNRILQKIGMMKINVFDYENAPFNFYSITKEDWKRKLTESRLH